MGNQTQDVLIKKVPAPLWQRIRTIAFLDDTTIRETVCKALTEFADRRKITPIHPGDHGGI